MSSEKYASFQTNEMIDWRLCLVIESTSVLYYESKFSLLIATFQQIVNALGKD